MTKTNKNLEPLGKLNGSSCIEQVGENMSGIYIHIPFCKKKCQYCDFNSFEYKDEMVDQYVEALCSEISMYKDTNTVVKTVFLGGGTPSVLSVLQLRQIVAALTESFDMDHVEEFTIEMNPDTVEEALTSALRELGINRVSMGLQSSDDDMLKVLGRLHDYETFEKAYDLLRQAGIENINIDLMFGLPNQSLDLWCETVKKVIDLRPEHVSAYSLKVEEGTPFFKLNEEGLLHLPTEDEDREMYHYIVEALGAVGLNQYEISNFSKKDHESQHNLIYWKNENYVGLGLGAHGSLDGRRYANVTALKDYHSMVVEGKKPIESETYIDEKEHLFETIMLGLRLNDGILIDQINNRYDIDLLEYHKDIIDDFVVKGLLVVDKGYMKLTKQGFDVSNSVMMAFWEDA